MQELLKKIIECNVNAYLEYKKAELTEDAERVAYLSGVISGIEKVLDIIEETIK